MDWQEKTFHRVWHWVKALKQGLPWGAQPAADAAADAAGAVCLDSIRPELTLLARLLSGAPTEILTAEAEGGLRDGIFYLPARLALGADADENRAFYVFRVACLSLQRELPLSEALQPPDDPAQALAAARAATLSQAERLSAALAETYPGLVPVQARFSQCLQAQNLPEYWLWGRWLRPLQSLSSTAATPQAAEARPREAPQTVLEAPAREEVQVLQEDREAMDKYNLQHYYEKVETLDEFKGTWRQADGSDELEAHAEALQELDLREVVRSDQPVHSVLQSEFLPGASAPESKDRVAAGYFVSYDEWDQRQQAYRKGYCRVYPQTIRQRDPAYLQQTLQAHRVTLLQLRQRFARVFNQLETVRRQLDGAELDLDALVDYHAERHAGHTPDERLYLSRRKRRQQASVLVLMDLSLSTDGYTGGERVLDVEKQAVLLFGSLLADYGDRFRVDGFASRTRHHCDYITFKDFDTPWAQAAPRIGAAEPMGYTRIGPALRHATALLKQEATAARWIILLSDGKPNDYDRYEGRHGLADVRQAIREARRDGVQVQALAIESRARHYLPLMLGGGAYRILPHPRQLPETLARFYTRLAHSTLR
ncbi:MAG: VWA domain-containing protein [Candidatus Sericytochromatia bacterium]|nr:VWA domain-containing protein [Candidatus Sericytochromatia bacterium]